MAENHVTVTVSSEDVRQIAERVVNDDDTLDMQGHINGQPVTVRFRPWEPDEDLASPDEIAERGMFFVDETVGPDGEFLTHGRCDTCGAPCDENGCPVNREHPVALDINDWDNVDDLVREQAQELAFNAINANEQFEWLLANGWTWDVIKTRMQEKGSNV